MKNACFSGTVLALLCLFVCLCGCRFGDTGMLTVRVLDGWEDRPVENARVVIAETGDACVTDADGWTDRFTVPILYDRHFSRIHPQNWGTVTLLVYADGYYAQVLYGVRTERGDYRDDLRIRLFPNDGSMADAPFLLVEPPESGWVNGLLAYYRQ